MKRRERIIEGKAAIELIEEAFHLLRLTPLRVWFLYFIGAVPFVLAILYFWSEMSRSAFAEEHLVGGATTLALSFVWMKTWQALFACEVHALAAGRTPPPITVRRMVRIAFTQAAVQPFGLVLIPVALVAVVPAAWAYAFFQNVTAANDGENAEVLPVLRHAWNNAFLWPYQNHMMLSTLFLFVLFVLGNWFAIGMAVPKLLQMLLGIESAATLSPQAMLNSTFLAVTAGLTYLTLDPFVKAIYALRCFYGEALHSGDDLRAVIRTLRASVKSFALALLLLVIPHSLHSAAEEPNRAKATPVSPQQLDQSIDKVIKQREYTWRLPRDKGERKKKPADQPKSIWEKIEAWLKDFFQQIDNFFRKLFTAKRPAGGPIRDWELFSISGLIWMFIALGVILAALLLIRAWLQRNRETPEVVSQGFAPVPDLTVEDVAADQLPEDGWIQLARELLERGELRLAVRAFYLATLAHLASRNLITIARFKSNRDYELELHRRSHALPDLFGVFSENVAVFERVWYGIHDVNNEMLEQFTSNVERIKAV